MSRARLLCAAAYVVALAAGYVAWRLSPWPDAFWSVVFADVVGTIVIFGFSRAFDNSSFYDAYWSVAPMAMVVAWATSAACISPRAWLVVGLVWLWGARLTYNWASHWTGLDHEDWRYVDLRRQTGALYWLVSFLGIHMFPTVMVLATSTGAYVAVRSATPLGWLDAVAAFVTLGAIVIETLADKQLRAFVRNNDDPERILDTGLWSWSRHPNYFGEVSFWWGLSLFGLAAEPAAYYTLIGPVALTAMFLFISIPMIEKRMLAKRPHFRAHQKRVSVLVPLPPSR